MYKVIVKILDKSNASLLRVLISSKVYIKVLNNRGDFFRFVSRTNDLDSSL